MSETSSQIRGEQLDIQSMQSVTLNSTGAASTAQAYSQQQQQQQQQQPQQQQQQQQRSSSQAERSERSGRSGGNRQRIQRSSSSNSTSDQSDGGREYRGESGAGMNIQSGPGFSQNTAHSQTNASGSQGSFVSGERRQGRFRRQVIRLPDQAQGQVRQVRQRLPTPEPDTIERV